VDDAIFTISLMILQPEHGALYISLSEICGFEVGLLAFDAHTLYRCHRYQSLDMILIIGDFEDLF